MLRPATHICYHITAILAAHWVQFVAQYKRWKYQVTTRTKKTHRERQWRFPKSKDFLKQYPCFASMLNKMWNLTWYAHIGAFLLDPRFSVQYIGRYKKRAVMAEYRIVYYDGKIVRFSYKDYAEGAKTSYMTLKVYTLRSFSTSKKSPFQADLGMPRLPRRSGYSWHLYQHLWRNSEN